MKNLLGVVFGLVVLIFSGCHRDEKPKAIETREMGKENKNLIIPSAVWKKIENDFAKQNAAKAVEGGEEEKKTDSGEGASKNNGEHGENTVQGKQGKASTGNEIKSGGHSLKVDKEELEALLKKAPPTENFPFQVSLEEKTNGILGGKNFLLKFPPGGGTLDLASFVSESPKGSFYLKLVWDQESFPWKNAKIYFVSRSKIRQVGDLKLGSGCSAVFDLTEYWMKTMPQGGLFLNTTHDRHISVLAGTYYLNVFKDGKIYQALLTVLDSRHRDLLCVSEMK